MQLFRRLAGNIFFKIILGIVALSFVFFGISGFILGSPNSWIAKVGGTTITQNSFSNALRADREIILSGNKSPEAVQYTETERFKSDVLRRLVNKIMIEKVSDDLGISASKKIILGTIAKDPSFKNTDGKFDHERFKAFLAKNGLNEERYVNEIANEVTSVMVLQSLALTAPVGEFEIVETENFKQEKRVADVITISEKNITQIQKPSKEEIEQFYSENKQGYTLPELRQVSYIQFSKSDFAGDIALTEKDLLAAYEKNKSQMLQPESRSFYHMLFDKEEDAKNFLEKFKTAAAADKSKSKAEFAKLSKSLKNKDLKAITLNNITQKDLIPQLTEVAFKLNENEISEAVQSPLGFHVFLLTGKKEAQPLTFAQAKESLKKSLAQNREEKVLQEKISAIDDLLLTSNSLSEVAKKFNLKVNSSASFDSTGNDEKGQQIAQNKNLESFAANAFALKENQTSKVFYAKNSSGFYAIKVEKVIPARERKLAEVESQIVADLAKKKKGQMLRELANKVADEVKADPSQAAQIAAKYHVGFDKGREFARQLYITLQGRQIAYQSKFLAELFALKLNQATSAVTQDNNDLQIGILREVRNLKASNDTLARRRSTASEDLRSELMSEYNSYLLAQHPIKVNEKIFARKAE